ncbi:hypothetical protein AD948_00945 [Acetobacter senegalensis]|uniref:Uncharacterized protein n=3 Tax=Acetobacteraceae TaxID=433 RepID=A0A149U8A1_9PROT|nr:hypothetical protein AD947_15100 [Acetobacter tropicalis]KXV61658.1 hypothetical protein AD948_00945 [Acetobacter senegalensis]
MVGPEITDENGLDHKINFEKDGVLIVPALPLSWEVLWRKNGMHVVTNIVSGDPLPADGGFIAKGSLFKSSFDPQFYSGTVDGYFTDKIKNTTKLFMGLGWHPWQNFSPQRNDGLIPGKQKDDKLDGILYNKYKHANLFIGTYQKAFLGNQQCSIIRDIKTTDGNSIARLDSPATACTSQEYDLIYKGTDFGATMKGVAVSYLGPNKPSASSYGFAVNGDLPMGYIGWLGVDGYDFNGDAFVTGSRRGPLAIVGQDKEMGEFLQSEDALVDNPRNYQRLVSWQHVDTIGIENTGQHTFRDNSLHFGPIYGGDKFLINGTLQAQLIFNPPWEKWGVAVCGASGNGSKSNCLTVSSKGTITSGGDFVVGDTTGKRANLIVTGLYQERLYTPENSKSSCEQGQFSDDENYHYVCVRKNHWKRVALSSW